MPPWTQLLAALSLLHVIGVQSECDAPEPLPFGDINYTDEVTIIYTCEDGYTLMGVKENYCTGNEFWQAWQFDPPMCHGICGMATPPSDGYLIYESPSVRYFCDESFSIHGSQENYCNTTSKSWAYAIPMCHSNTCGHPPNADVEHGCYGTDNLCPIRRTQLPKYHLAQTISYLCKIGYQFEGAKNVTMTCLIDNKWSHKDILCTLYSCGHPPDADTENGCYSDSDFCNPTTDLEYRQREYNLTETVPYICKPFYQFEGPNIVMDVTVTCLNDGTWSHKDIMCTLGAYCKLPKAKQGFLQFDKKNPDVLKDYYNPFEEVSLRCPLTSALVGSGHLTCGENAEWNDTLPTCLEKTCIIPTLTEHLTLYVDKEDRRGLNQMLIGASITYRCDDQAQLTGQSEDICERGITLSDDMPTCSEMTCVLPTLTEHLRMTVNPNDRRHHNELIVGAIIKYSCDGQTSWATCTHGGKMSHGIPRCGDEMTCVLPTLTEHLHMNVNQTDRRGHNEVMVGAIVIYSCDASSLVNLRGGFSTLRQYGQSRITCEHNQEMSHILPSCYVVHTTWTTLPSTAHVNTASVYSTAAVVLLAIILWLSVAQKARPWYLLRVFRDGSTYPRGNSRLSSLSSPCGSLDVQLQGVDRGSICRYSKRANMLSTCR